MESKSIREYFFPHSHSMDFENLNSPDAVHSVSFEGIFFFLENCCLAGNYSQLLCELYLTRAIGFYVSQVYIPSFLIVVISWVPFWLDQNHHARVALGITTVLTMTTLMTSNKFTVISHLKSIDIYIFVSFLVVFLSLIQYATVGHVENRVRVAEVLRAKKSRSRGYFNSMSIDSNENEIEMKRKKSTLGEAEQAPIEFQGWLMDIHLIDQWARWGFPIFFFVFNIFYIVIMVVLTKMYHIPKSALLQP